VLLRSVAGGRQSMAQDGQEQDWFTLDECAPALAGVSADDVHDRFVFAGNVPLVRDVYVGGQRVVQDGRHPRREEIATRYRRALRALLADG
jgi:formimidoylglutamate deiminase